MITIELSEVKKKRNSKEYVSVPSATYLVADGNYRNSYSVTGYGNIIISLAKKLILEGISPSEEVEVRRGNQVVFFNLNLQQWADGGPKEEQPEWFK